MSEERLPPRRPAAEPWNRPHIRAWAGAIGIYLVLIGLTWLATRYTAGWDHSGDSVRVLTRTGSTPLRGGLFLSWAGALVFIVRSTRRVMRSVIATAIAAIVAVGCSADFDLFGNTRWYVRDRVTARDGRELRALFSPGWDNVRALAEVADSGLLAERLTIRMKGEFYGDAAGEMLRPERHRDRVGLFFEELPNGTIVLLEHDTFHGDPAGYFYGAAFAIDRHGYTLTVSPFAMFRADDVGDDARLAEFAALETRFDEFGSPPAPRAQDEHVRAALDHGSAWVRRAAEQLIETGFGAQRFPSAAKALRERREE